MATTDIFSAALKKLLAEIGDRNTPCAEDPELFLDLWANSLSIRHAKRLCNECHVKTLCLQTALADNEPMGIWGGLTPDERKRVRRRGR